MKVLTISIYFIGIIEAKLDLSSFGHVLVPSTKFPKLTSLLDPGESKLLFHVRLLDKAFKEPLRPLISYKPYNKK